MQRFIVIFFLLAAVLAALADALSKEAELVTMRSTVALQNSDPKAAVELAREALALSPHSVQAEYNLFVTERLARKIFEEQRRESSAAGSTNADVRQQEQKEFGVRESSAHVGYYRRREPFGWEWVIEEKEDGEEELSFDDSRFLYHLKLLLPSEELGPDEAKAKADRAKALGLPHVDGTPFVLSLSHGDNPAKVVAAFAKHAGAMPRVKQRWLVQIVQNGVGMNLNAPVFGSHEVRMTTGEREGQAMKIDVHLGDDLAQLARWHGDRLRLLPSSVEALLKMLIEQTPEHSSPRWLKARAQRDLVGLGKRGSDLDIDRECFEPKEDVDRDCFVTVAFTTCKRLDLFRFTVRSLAQALGGNAGITPSETILSHPKICRVLVVDDGSSEADREAMRAEFPAFQFVMKPSPVSDPEGADEWKGHARSLNVILAAVDTRYMLYLEDDWLTLDEVTSRQIIDDPITVLQHSRNTQVAEPVAQVLLNDQSSRACAYAIAGRCGAGVIGTSGWAREALGRQGGGDEGKTTKYRLHEFGTTRSEHAFSFWPGFTFNPAMWDLDALRCALSRAEKWKAISDEEKITLRWKNGTGSSSIPMRQIFDPDDDRFEQSFSVRCHDAGLRVAYLEQVIMAHIGVNNSAYVLNGVERAF